MRFAFDLGAQKCEISESGEGYAEDPRTGQVLCLRWALLNKDQRERVTSEAIAELEVVVLAGRCGRPGSFLRLYGQPIVLKVLESAKNMVRVALCVPDAGGDLGNRYWVGEMLLKDLQRR